MSIITNRGLTIIPEVTIKKDTTTKTASIIAQMTLPLNVRTVPILLTTIVIFATPNRNRYGKKDSIQLARIVAHK